jgi:threonyl-tRNA synthetase
VDFNFPERFNLSYRTADNGEEQPWMLHRAIFGSIERFLGILLEHYAGALPLWLAPVQVAVVPIADRHNDYAFEVKEVLSRAGGRVEVFDQNEPMRAKIAKAQLQKIPYMLVVGDREAAERTVSVRERKEGDQGSQALAEFAEIIAGARI